MPFVIALVVAGILGAATWFLGDRVIPDTGMVAFLGQGDMADWTLTRLHLATGLAAFVGWSLGLLVGARR